PSRGGFRQVRVKRSSQLLRRLEPERLEREQLEPDLACLLESRSGSLVTPPDRGDDGDASGKERQQRRRLPVRPLQVVQEQHAVSELGLDSRGDVGRVPLEL